MPVIATDLEQVFQSQEKHAALDLDVAYPGHGKVIEPDASKIIGLFVDRKKTAG